jgi:hypothetical protein
VLSGLADVAISLAGVSYIVIDGIGVDNSLGWAHRQLQLQRCATCGCRGPRPRAPPGREVRQQLQLQQVAGQHAQRWQRLADHPAVGSQPGCRQHHHRGPHSIFSVRCGNFNVLRNNTFTNTQQKIGEIYDCEGTSDAPVMLDATKHNLVDDNRFTYTAASSRNYNYNGIQYAGQQGHRPTQRLP